MKNFTFILITILSITVTEAQQSNQFYVDSLKHELTIAKEDTNKVMLLVRLSYLYSDFHADSGVVYAQQALDLAKKSNFELGVLYAEGNLSLSLQITGNYPLSLDHGFKALSLAKKIKPSLASWTLSLVAYCYYYLGDYNTFLKYTLEGLQGVQDWEIPYGWRDLALVYHNLNEPDSAILYAKKAYEKFKGSAMEGNVSNALGDAYAGKANYDSALFLYRNGISASLKNHTGTDLIDNYNGIAGMYKATNNFDSAAWYSKKVLSEKIENIIPLVC
jgi:two-component system NtrC family sensor kinase